MDKTIQKDLLFPEIIWERPVHYYKNQAGRILVLAGSKGSPNRASIVCEAVFRSGTGIITLGFPDILKNIYKDFLPDQMTLLLKSTPSGSISQNNQDQILEQIKSSDVVLLGPGLSQNAETIHLIWEIITQSSKDTIVVDDAVRSFIIGIEVIRKEEDENYLVDYFKKINHNIILVINNDELLKIIKACKLHDFTKIDVKKFNIHIEDFTNRIAEKLNLTIVLNGKEQIITNKDKLIINNPNKISFEISNDLLSGVIASFVAQNKNKLLESIATATYLLSKAYELSQEKFIDKRIMSSDILRELPNAIKEAEKD